MSIIPIDMATIFVSILKMVDFEPLLTSQIPCSLRLRLILLDEIEGFSSENNFFLWSILTVVTHKISSSIAYQLLKILHQFIQLMYFPIKLSKRTGRQWVLGKKIFLFVLLCLILWQWFFFYTTLWLTSTLSLMHHNENSCRYSITESPLEKSSIKLPSTLFLSA